MNDQDVTLAEAVRVVCDDLLDRNRDGVSPLHVAHEVERRYTELFEAEALVLARRQLVKAAKAQLSPTATEQEELPGFGGLPRTFTVGDGEGGYRYVALKHATLADEAADYAEKSQNAQRVESERQKAERRHERLWSAPGATETMPVLEAARRLAS